MTDDDDKFELIFMSYEGRKKWLAQQAVRTDKLSKKERAKIKEVKASVVDMMLYEKRRELERFGYRFERAASEYHSWDLNRAACVAMLARADDHCEKCGCFCPENFGNDLDIHHMDYPGLTQVGLSRNAGLGKDACEMGLGRCRRNRQRLRRLDEGCATTGEGLCPPGRGRERRRRSTI
jgi:hypothetical protein